MNKEKNEKKLNMAFIVAGCVLCVLSMLPFFILGKKSIITYNDQLDGEMITYILNAKHLFDGLDYYPELMNGIPSAGMTSPAPLFILLFKVFSPFVSFMIMTLAVRLSGFLSMYLFTKELTGKRTIGFAVGMAFMMMPFYPVYGLCILGQGFVWCALIWLIKEEKNNVRTILAYVFVVLYSLTSSLALVGFAVIIVTFIAGVVTFFKSKRGSLKVFIADALMVVTYACTNLPLIKQLIGVGSDFVSHKSEIIVQKRTIPDIIERYLFGSDQYTSCCQKVIIPFAILAVIVSIILLSVKSSSSKKESTEKGERNKTGEETKPADVYKKTICIVVFIGAVMAFIFFYNSSPVVALRNAQTGMIHDFTFERFSWLLPVAFMALLAESINVLTESVKTIDKKVFKYIVAGVSAAVCLLVFAIAGFKSDSKTSLMRLIKGSGYKQISFGQFYSEELFDEVERTIGRDREDYNVISLGHFPASAAYNGFHCLDAYSNNYDVNYKHEFREIMAGELAKSEYYTDYFDNWGNRCYIYMSAYKTGINASFYNISFEDLNLDFEKAKEMGAAYVISASPIVDFDSYNLRLLNETPVSSEGCWYELYVYEIL